MHLNLKFSNPYIKQNHPHYIGLTERTFKDRLYKHNNSFKYKSKRNSTELSNFIWGKKKEKINVDLDLDKAKPYSPASKNTCYVLQRNITSFSLQSIC